jgi:flagellar capping protein FliD
MLNGVTSQPSVLTGYNNNIRSSVNSNSSILSQPNADSNKKIINITVPSDSIMRITGTAHRLASAIERLRDKSIYNNYYAESSDSNAVKIKDSSRPTALSDTELEVDEVASGQINTGHELSGDSEYTGDTGRQTLSIDIDGRSHEVTVEIGKGETNKQVLQKIADAVNAEGIGIEASVTGEDENNGIASLVFQSESTGELPQNEFAVRDVSGGELAANTGVTQVTSEAKDAVYTVDGRQHTSHSNDVALENGVSVTLLEKTTGPVDITVKQSTELAEDAANYFTDAFNDFVSSIEDNPKLKQFVNDFLDKYASDFDRIGIIRNQDGNLSVDKGKLIQAIKNGDMANMFTPDGSLNNGMLDNLHKTVNDAATNPSSFVGEQSQVDIYL